MREANRDCENNRNHRNNVSIMEKCCGGRILHKLR